MGLALALVLLLRLLGPGLLAQAQPGYVLICTGTEMVAVPLGPDGATPAQDDTSRPTPMPCLWHAGFLAVLPVLLMLLALLPRRAPARPAAWARPPAQGARVPFLARGPPLMAT